jgi:hypothetical protein
MRRGWLLAVAALGLVRCSAFGGDDASAPAGPAAQDASVTDSPSSVDASEASTSDAGSPCATPHALCDDFERSGPALDPARWSTELGAALHSIDSVAGATSGTSALVIAQNDGGTDSYFLQKSFAGPLQRLHCSFQYEILSNPGAYGYPFIVLLSSGTNGDYNLRLDARPASDGRNAFLERQPLENADYPPVLTGVWTKIEFELPPLELWSNTVGAPVSDAGGVEPTGPFASGTVKIGLQTNAGNAGWRVAVDDVVCDVE